MTTSQFTLAVGLVLGLVATFGGFGHFLIVAVFAVLGWLVGRYLEGKLDLRALTGRTTDRL